MCLSYEIVCPLLSRLDNDWLDVRNDNSWEGSTLKGQASVSVIKQEASDTDTQFLRKTSGKEHTMATFFLALSDPS